MKVLVAGVGNVLRGDDAFGVEVARRMAAETLPPEVRVVETGIAGVALVHELQEGWDALIVADAVARDKAPGTVMLIELEVGNVDEMTWAQRADFLADMHLATPERALMLARALGVLPPRVLMVGCQPVDAEEVGEGMSPPVTAAVELAVQVIHEQVAKFLAPEPAVAGCDPPVAVAGCDPKVAVAACDPQVTVVGCEPEAAVAGIEPSAAVVAGVEPAVAQER